MWPITIGGKLWVRWDFGTEAWPYISVNYAEDSKSQRKNPGNQAGKHRTISGKVYVWGHITAWVLNKRHVRSLAMDAEEEKQSKTHIHGQLVEINHNQEKRIRHEETKAQNLTTGFAVVQVLILNTLVINKPSGRCEHWWVPFSLSLSVGVIYFVTIFEVVKKCYLLLYHLDVNYMEQEAILLEMHGGAPSRRDDQPLKPDVVKLLRRKAYITILISAMLAFQALMLHACSSFLCNWDQPLAMFTCD